MKLSKPAVKAIKDNSDLRRLLAYVIRVHVQTVWEYAKKNDTNGPLTAIKAIEAIASETGMFQNQILVDEKAFAA